jgi:membrane protein implicated in regulation of membrane protease activity
VRYRDTLWDAVVQGDAAAPGDTRYIVAVDGSTLRVARRA